ncbi:MAG: ABC transporter permease subunit, partial [Planctomycetota bacterium]
MDDANLPEDGTADELVDEVPGDVASEPSPPARNENSRFAAPRISRLAMKELRETLRDRRTIVTLILMPLLVYPILSLVFRTFLFNTADSLRQSGPERYSFVVDGEAPDRDLFAVITQLGLIVEGYVPDDASPGQVRQNDADGGNDVPSSPEEIMERAAQGNDEQGNDGEAVDESPQFDPARRIGDYWEHNWAFPSRELPQTVETIVETGQADAGLRLILEGRERFQLARYEIIYDPEDATSSAAARYLREAITKANKAMLSNALRASYDPIQEVGENRVSLSEEAGGGSGRVSLAAMIPLILVLMTITGAVYPAIDLTAGERERGTLETLMAAPVPRMGILFSKFVAVLTVAVLTASLNILGMAATVWAFGLDAFFGHEAGLTAGMILRIFGLLVLFASFFSAILLAVTSYARSFKEAQSYLIPIILLSMAPGLMAMTPGLSLAGPLCVTPMVNLLLLARDVLQQQVIPAPSLIAVISTLIYTGLAIFVAARIFGTDAILYGSQGSW